MGAICPWTSESRQVSASKASSEHTRFQSSYFVNWGPERLSIFSWVLDTTRARTLKTVFRPSFFTGLNFCTLGGRQGTEKSKRYEYWVESWGRSHHPLTQARRQNTRWMRTLLMGPVRSEAEPRCEPRIFDVQPGVLPTLLLPSLFTTSHLRLHSGALGTNLEVNKDGE